VAVLALNKPSGVPHFDQWLPMFHCQLGHNLQEVVRSILHCSVISKTSLAENTDHDCAWFFSACRICQSFSSSNACCMPRSRATRLRHAASRPLGGGADVSTIDLALDTTENCLGVPIASNDTRATKSFREEFTIQIQDASLDERNRNLRQVQRQGPVDLAISRQTALCQPQNVSSSLRMDR
jgi:hypothetical protein